MKKVVLVVLVAVLVAVGFAYAATNSVPESGAGDGSGTISGYTVTDVKYQLDTTDPSTIGSVSFTITPTSGALSPTSVKIQLVSTDTTNWYNCTGGGSSWTCSVNGAVSVLDADNLRVVAAQ